jgi:hypothetical protein
MGHKRTFANALGTSAFGPFVIPMLTNVRVRSPSNSDTPELNEMSLLLRKISGDFSADDVSKNPSKPSATALV